MGCGGAHHPAPKSANAATPLPPSGDAPAAWKRPTLTAIVPAWTPDVDDLCHPGRLSEAVITKLNLLPPGRFAHERLEQGIRLMLEMIREAVCGRYRRLPLTALDDFLDAIHYFLKWRDRRPDTWDGGYMDDLEVVLQALAAHEPVVTAYRQWLSAHGGRERATTHHRPSVVHVEFGDEDALTWRLA
jgi:uncharacterized membrane protein YkvA (DUF1232 family)